MSFQTAVTNTPEIRNCYQQGLKALGGHSTVINVRETRACEGSVNLDTCLLGVRPDDNRWDYCFAYKGEAYFVEVHPADTSNVETVINKLNWLRAWLINHAPAINALKAAILFHWIHTGSSHILAGSKQYRMAAEHKILPKARLDIRH